MGWRFWKNDTASTPASRGSPSIDWPTDAYASLRLLAALYVRGAYPFSEWRAAQSRIDSDLEAFVRRTVQAHQLHIWFSSYLLQRGELEAKMLRDVFPRVLDELVPNLDLGDRARRLLEEQSSAVDYSRELPELEQAAAQDATSLESTAQWHFAYYFLGFSLDSPYLELEEIPDDQQHALAACLEEASNAAQQAFEPMLQAVTGFDAARLPAWEWWDAKGAHERHLERRHNNPIFPAPRRIVTVSDVYAARVLDMKDYQEACDALESIGRGLATFQLSDDWDTSLGRLKAQLEALHDRVSGMDRCGEPLKARAEYLRGHAVGYLTDTLKHADPSQLPRIEAGEARRAQFLARHPSDWSWQVYRGDVIPDDEAMHALLCENVSSIARILKEESFREVFSRARPELIAIARQAQAEGHEIGGLEEKLALLGRVPDDL